MTYLVKIYKIVNTINDEIYVGSTKNELRVRWQGHKDAAKKNPERNGLYQMMNDDTIVINEIFRIVLIETVECENREEQIRHEQRYIDMLKPKLNKVNSYRRCEHNRERHQCVDCNGSSICIHKKQRHQCVDCNCSGICIHKKQRRQCVDCNGSGICIHKKYRHKCIDCNGSQTQKVYCHDCGTEFRRDCSKYHYNSAKHLRNTLPINY